MSRTSWPASARWAATTDFSRYPAWSLATAILIVAGLSSGEHGPDQQDGDDGEGGRDHDVVARPAALLAERVEAHGPILSYPPGTLQSARSSGRRNGPPL